MYLSVHVLLFYFLASKVTMGRIRKQMALIKVCDQQLRCRHFPIIYLNTTASPYIVVPIDAEQASKASFLFLQAHLIHETLKQVDK